MTDDKKLQYDIDLATDISNDIYFKYHSAKENHTMTPMIKHLYLNVMPKYQKWCKAHMKQTADNADMTFNIPDDVYLKFKVQCDRANVPMASVMRNIVHLICKNGGHNQFTKQILENNKK